VSYDNSFRARTDYIGLTTVDNNYAEMGRIAARQLAHRIDAPGAARSVTLLEPNLLVRKTTRPIQDR
jgi:DNA-binding LacI/PurR family transcriptional regulator